MSREIDIERVESNRITIGIPCFQNAPAETLDDYMRFAYYLGRRYPEWEFWIAIKAKTEQFRARNALVTAALQVDSKYLLMLDDDHVIDWDVEGLARFQPASNYEFLRKMIDHMEADPKLGIVGALYYHRGGPVRPVLMKEGEDGGFYWLRDDEITKGLQEVAVTGGGCMLLRCEALLMIPEPIFQPEFKLGTDLQVCKAMRERGWKVACDTSIEIGHVKHSREIITSKTRLRHWSDSVTKTNDGFKVEEGIDNHTVMDMSLAHFRGDVEDFSGIGFHEFCDYAKVYEQNAANFSKYKSPQDYYSKVGIAGLVRNCLYQYTQGKREINNIVLSLIRGTSKGYGLDFGCGPGYLGFELAQRGHNIDFVDVEGSKSYEFCKWRVNKRGLGERCGFEIKGPYDYILMMDVIEHLDNWQEYMLKLSTLLKEQGAIFTNFWVLEDDANPEHINMDRDSVKDFLIGQGIYPINQLMWMKYDLSQVGKKKDSSHAA